MLRITLAAVAAALCAPVALAESARPVRQAGVERPGGTSLTLPAEDADACAAQCAKDGLCLAWSYQPAAGLPCSLKAVVTPTQASQGVISGLAARAPSFAALVGAETPAAQPAHTVRTAALAPSKNTAKPTPAALPKKPLPADDDELLGGPNDPS